MRLGMRYNSTMMKITNFPKAAAGAVALAAVCAAGGAFAEMYGDPPDAMHAWAVHDWNRPKPHRVGFDAKGVPSDAVVLFDGTEKSYRENWVSSSGGAPKWKFADGAIAWVPGRRTGGLKTKAEFGDCQLHIEFRHPAGIKSKGGPQMRGNSGVFFMGADYGYEVQVLESHFTCEEMKGKPGYVDNYADGQAGSVYGQNPPAVNPQKKPGEWQVYDIVFHQPVFKDGKTVHPGSLTVFMNGVLVQDHWELEGQTEHKMRTKQRVHGPKGPLALQNHGCEVEFRNIWLRPLPSRWANKTHSRMSADPAEVAKLRRETAAALYAKIANPDACDAGTVKALAEVVSYSGEAVYREKLLAAARKFDASKPSAADRKGVKAVLGVLSRSGTVPEGLVK